MNKLIIIFAMLFTVIVAKAAFGAPPAAQADPQLNRVLSDTVMIGALKAIETKYGITCTLPTESKKLNWQCTNSTSCFYSFNVPCGTPATTLTEADHVLDVLITGFDTGHESQLRSFSVALVRH